MKRAGPSRRSLIGLLCACAVVPAAAQERQRLVLATGAAGGRFHAYGPALAEVVERHGAIELDVQTTGGSNDNLRAILAGEADLGLVSLGPAYRAWEGSGPFASQGPQRSLRALFPMYEAPLVLVALRGRGIARLADLRGRSVGVGPAGGPGDVFFKALAKALAIEARIVTGAPGDLVRQALAGEVDALWFAGSLPVASAADVAGKADAVVVGLGTEEVAALRSLFPFFVPSTIPAATYRGQTGPIGTASVWNFVLCSDRLADDAAFAVTRAALGHTSEIAAALPVASGTQAVHVGANGFLPFHPGAVRYYREAGIAIPAALIPT